MAALLQLVEGFQPEFDRLVTKWNDLLPAMAADGPVALWGAGSKGVAFLSFVEASSSVHAVVDINPRKHGLHVPGSGHPISAPSDLTALRPAHVLLANAAYQPEVSATLANLGVAATITAI